MDTATLHIQSSSFDFLQKLNKNNNREWFNEHKEVYQRELLKVESFVDTLLDRMKAYDAIDTPSGKKAMMRIYRDIRFSADKTPYKTNWSGGFHRLGKQRRGGYYFSFEPGGESMIAGGFWGPNPADLKIIRNDIAFDDKPLRKVLGMPGIVAEFKTLTGEALKTVPRGYEVNDPGADLLRYKQFILERRFTDKEVLADGFLDKAVATMRALRPFFDHMSEVLYQPE
ncbi:hypothetical protein F5148DRAFT_985503 [Russula earlei]|uniref:Uncharacterized protein n=1 Tax=Russula earlei TaxID=71964 RepID=A0ACC0U045_9AGAM|nr:hypothetical protein F5148DRAFT_985503 [Russula earlei]